MLECEAGFLFLDRHENDVYFAYLINDNMWVVERLQLAPDGIVYRSASALQNG